MAFVCGLTGLVPTVPVVSPVSGVIFEKMAIESHLSKHGNKDPITKAPLRKEDLIQIRLPPVKASKSTAYITPQKASNEDGDPFATLDKNQLLQINAAQQELIEQMRVLIKNSQKTVDVGMNSAKTTEMNVPDGRPLAICDASNALNSKLDETATKLMKERKQRRVRDYVCSSREIARFEVIFVKEALYGRHSPAILSLDHGKNYLATGGMNGAVCIFNTLNNSVVKSFKGHTKEVLKVACHPFEELVVSGSMDSTVGVWTPTAKKSLPFTQTHTKAISGVAVHPSGDYVLSTSLDKTWTFSDIRTGTILLRNTNEDSPITSSSLHPDGLVLATGISKSDTLNRGHDFCVRLWDLKTNACVVGLLGHTGTVTSVAMSENGYHMATAGEDGHVRLHDLRKISSTSKGSKGPFLKETAPKKDGPNTVRDISFDQSGSYLALAGSDLRVFNTKNWQLEATFLSLSDDITGVRFGSAASKIFTTASDGALKILG